MRPELKEEAKKRARQATPTKSRVCGITVPGLWPCWRSHGALGIWAIHAARLNSIPVGDPAQAA
jgi:hypothetical protein